MEVVVRALLLALLCLLPALPTLALVETPPDIIVVLLDDMRTSDWRALPETQKLLADGTRFENFILTTPLCCPSRASLLSGRYAHNHKVKSNRQGWQHFRPHEDTALPTLLSGYETALIGKYLNGYQGDSPTPPGWDTWEVYRGKPSYDWRSGYSTDVQRDLAVDFLEGASGPQMLWFAPYAPHKPATYATRHANEFQDASGHDRDRLRTILAVDEAVVAIKQAMGNRWDQACVFVLSDNGYLINGREKNVPKDAAVRVPMLARCPGLGSGKDARIVANIDLAPTLLRAAGEQIPATMDGRALQDGAKRDRILIEGWKGNGATRNWSKVWTTDGILGKRRAGAWLGELRHCAGDECRDADGGG
jgi:N-acetylglucosamine-6-sulfatase